MAEEKKNFFKRTVEKIDEKTDAAWFPALYGAIGGALVGLLGWACGARSHDRTMGKYIGKVCNDNAERVEHGMDPIPVKFLGGEEFVFCEINNPAEESEDEKSEETEE